MAPTDLMGVGGGGGGGGRGGGGGGIRLHMKAIQKRRLELLCNLSPSD